MTATITPRRVNQAELARELGITDRRVRQLVEERILWQPRSDEGYDLELCRQRYHLYKSGSDREWEAVFVEAEDLANLASELYDKAYDGKAEVADVSAASIALQKCLGMQCFLTAVKSKSQAERDLFFTIWDREENQVLGELLARGMELLGKTHLRTDDGHLIEVIPAAPRAKARRAKGRSRATGVRQ